MLEKTPRDTFLLYAIALEHKKLKEFDQAIEYLDKVVEVDPAYCVAYQQAGQTHALAGRIDAARQAYVTGIAAARQAGDRHAADEMEGELTLLGGR